MHVNGNMQSVTRWKLQKL